MEYNKLYVILNVITLDGNQNQELVVETSTMFCHGRLVQKITYHHKEFPQFIKYYNQDGLDHSHWNDPTVVSNCLKLDPKCGWNKLVHKDSSMNLDIWQNNEFVGIIELGQIGKLATNEIRRGGGIFVFDSRHLAVPKNLYGIMGIDFIKSSDGEKIKIVGIDIETDKIHLFSRNPPKSLFPDEFVTKSPISAKSPKFAKSLKSSISSK